MEWDWYSWLSKTGLDQSLIYEYGLAFSHNQLQKDDLTYFNHEFLQSMGISVAKHRLEILKLANKETKSGTNQSGGGGSLSSKFIGAVNKTKRCLNRFVVNKFMVHHHEPIHEPVARLFSRKCKSEKELMRLEQPLPPPPRYYKRSAKSGPLDGRGYQDHIHSKTMMVSNTARSLKLSGPLDKRTNDKLMYKSPMLSGPIGSIQDQRLTFQPHRSPMLSGPLYIRPTSPQIEKEKVGGDNTLWAALFQDMKPT